MFCLDSWLCCLLTVMSGNKREHHQLLAQWVPNFFPQEFRDVRAAATRRASELHHRETAAPTAHSYGHSTTRWAMRERAVRGPQTPQKCKRQSVAEQLWPSLLLSPHKTISNAEHAALHSTVDLQGSSALSSAHTQLRQHEKQPLLL